MHLWERRDTMFKGVAIGKKPWSPRGEVYGRNLVDGKIVMQAPIVEKNTDLVLCHMAQLAVHLNPDTEIAAKAATILLHVRDGGAVAGSQDRVCPTCGRSYADQREVDKNFKSGVRFRWATLGIDAAAVKFVGDQPCKGCYERLRDAIKGVQAEAVRHAANPPKVEDMIGRDISAGELIALSGGSARLGAIFGQIESTILEIGS